MKLRVILALALVLLTFAGCSATVQGVVTDPASVLNSAAGNTVDETGRIGDARAKTIALEQAGLKEADVSGLRVEYEIDDGVQQYDVEFRYDGWEYAYEIDARTGAVISSDKDKED